METLRRSHRNHNMKHVLVIANLFHSSPRIPGLTTYFPSSGWHATILTPPFSTQAISMLGAPKKFNENVSVLPAPFTGDVFEPLRKLMGNPSTEIHASITEKLKKSIGPPEKKILLNRLIWLAHLLFAYPDTEKTWIRSALETARSHLASNHYDALLSSSPFPTNHIIAHELKKKYSIPWCADFRDPWTQNHTYNFPLIRKFFEERLEKRILKTANAIVAATPEYSAKQSRLLERKIETIPNGFDPEQYPYKPLPLLDQQFSITYTGTIYPEKQNPLPFLDALQSLVREHRIDTTMLRVTFYGKGNQWLSEEIEKRKLAVCVDTPGLIPREQAIIKQRSSQVLLVLGWEDPKNKGVYPSKLFEYLGARRPILIAGGSNKEEIKNLVRNASAGSSGTTAEEIKNILLEYYHEYQNNGFISYRGNEEKIMAYSFPKLAEWYGKILHAL